MDVELSRMFSVLLLLVTVPFGLVTLDSIPLPKGCDISRKVDARRSLFTAKQEIGPHWSQPAEQSIKGQEHLVKYGSLARKDASFKDCLDNKGERQEVEGIQDNDEKRVEVNSTALGSEGSAQDMMDSNKRKGKQKQKEYGCSVFMRGALDSNTAEIDIACYTVDGTSGTLINISDIKDIKDSKSIPDMTSSGFKIFDWVDGQLFAIHVNQNMNLLLTNVNISNFKGLGSIFLVDGAGLDIRGGTIFDIFESQHSGVMSVRNSTVKVSDCVFNNTHGRHTGFATLVNSTFDLEDSNFEDNFGLEESLVFFATNSSIVNMINDTFVGTLPKTSDETALTSSTTRAWKNFKVVQARAGVAYMTNGSTLTIQSSHLMHVGSMRGLIYLEKKSLLLCKDSYLIHNIAIYGGAIFAQDSIANVTNVHAERNAASRGGTILFRGSSTGHLDSVVFKGNLASEGGAFYIEHDDCGLPDKQYLMSIKNCSFIGNRAYYEGGAVFTSCVSLDVVQSSFTRNIAWLGGGGIFANSSVDINLQQVIFSKNIAQEGGAISVNAEITQGNMTVERGTFIGNQADRGSGGAIMYRGNYSTLKLNLNDFSKNIAAEDGGAFLASRTQELDIFGGTFADNEAKNGSGGSIHIVRNIALTLNSATIRGSIASDDGGGLYVYKSKSFTSVYSQVMQNRAQKGDGGGIGLFCVGNITIKGGAVKGNIAGASGGGVSYKVPQYIPDDERNGTFLGVDLVYAMFQSNQATDGGGLFVHSIDALILDSCFFVDNKAVLKGGGILMENVTSVSLQGSNMLVNQATNGSGGALYGTQLRKFNVSLSIFEGNVGHLSGGALCLLQSPVLILEETRFEKNNATAQSGGAIALFDDTNIIVKKTFFHSNIAGRSGGAMYARQPQQAEIKDSQFESNIAQTRDGGGICFMYIDQKLNTTSYNASQPVNITAAEPSASSEDLPESISMSTTTFTRNKAQRHGGGLYLNRLRGKLTMDINPTFDHCKAIKGSGGCAYLSNIEEFLMVRGHLVDNTAKLNGGCFALINISRVDLNQSKFTSCDATSGKGGAVYYDGDPETKNTLMLAALGPSNCRAATGGACHISNVEVLFLDGSTFYESKAQGGSGGGLVANDVMEVYMRTVRVAESTASGSCGGICLTRVAYLILDGTFNNNHAKSHGGGAWLSDVTKAIITKSYSGNTAGKYGGALFLTNVSEAEIHSIEFNGNQAKEDGGAVSVWSYTSINLIESDFTQNKARDGGGLHIGVSYRENESLIKVSKCRFFENEARVNGGGVSINERYFETRNSITPSQTSPSSVEVSNCSLEHNKADNGGGMEVVAGDVRVEYNKFFKNKASGSGGAFYVNDPDFLLINNATIERNTADKGGALSVGCQSNMNLTDAVIRRNSAPKRDDGGLIACGRANISLSNVKFFHNFRDQEWYFYVLFPLCSYGLLLAFLLIGLFISQRYFQRKKRTVTYDTYSDIGEYDPSATDLSAFLAEPVAEVESDDEGIVAPKPSPMDPGAKSGHAISQSVSRRNDPEISEGSEEDAPIPQHRYPPRV